MTDQNRKDKKLIDLALQLEASHKREKKLQNELNKYKQMVEKSGDVFWIVDFNLDFQFISPASKNLFGYTLEERSTMSLDDILTSQSVQKVKSEFKRIISQQAPPDEDFYLNLELEGKHKNGNPVWIEIKTSPYFDSDGKFTGFKGVSRDITHKKQALQESEYRYHKIIENSPFAICIVHDKRISYVNNTALKFAGVKDDKSLIGKSIDEFVHPDYKQQMQERLQLITNHNINLPPVESILKNINGDFLNTRITAVPFLYHGKKSILYIIEDITAEKTANMLFDRTLQITDKLYQNAVNLLESKSDSNIFEYLCQTVNNIEENSSCLVSVYNEKHENLIPVCYKSSENNDNLKSLTSQTNNLLFSFSEDTQPELWKLLKTRQLELMQDVNDFFSISGISGQQYTNLTNYIASHQVFIIGIWWNKQLKAILCVFKPNKKEIKHPRVVETIVKQAAIALQKQDAEKELKKSKEFYKHVTSNMLDLVSITTPDGYFTYLSPAFKKVLGYEIEEMMHRSLFDFIHPDDKMEILELFQQRITKKGIGKAQYRYRKANGSYIWLESIGRVFSDENGKAVNAIFGTRDITSQRKISNALKNSEQQFKTIVNALPNLVAYVNKDFKYTFVNKTYERVFQKSPKEIIGLSLKDFIGEEAFQKALPSLKKVLSGQNVRYHQYFEYPNGYKAEMDGQLIADFDVNGKVKGYYAILTDITPYIEVQKSIAESEAKFRSLAENIQDFIVRYDTDFKYNYLNAASLKLIGKPKDKLLGKTHKQAGYEKEYVDFWYKKLRKVSNNGRMIHFQSSWKINGNHTILDTILNPEFDAQGKLISITEVSRDITIQNRAKKLMKQNQKRLKTLVELAQMTDFPLNELYEFTLKNAIELSHSKIGFIGFLDEAEKEVQITSWSKQSLNQCFVKNQHVHCKIAESGLWAEGILKRKPVIINNFSSCVKDKQGLPPGHIPVKKYLSIPIFDQKKIVAVIAVANKNTDYEKTDIQQLTLLMDGMWRIVSQRKYQRELQEAKNKAEESDKLKSSFLANMSHEIRTPMNGIVGFVDLLQKKQLKEESRKKYIDIIQSSTTQLLNIVNDILEIAKIDTGQVELKRSGYQLNLLMDELCMQYTNECRNKEKKQLEIVCKKGLGDDDSHILVDPSRLRQVLTNLMSNAMKFTRKGKVVFGYEQQRKNELIFYVKDTGIGIKKEKQQVIFERFRQEDESHTRKYGGTGLGLSISKGLVNLMGGEIWVESESKKGATFFFTLPLKKSQLKNSQKNSDVSDFNWKNKTFIIADDSEIMHNYFFEVLEETGVNCIFAKNGKEVLYLINKHPNIDLILMDIQMPEMDGYETTRNLRQKNKNVPIIAQTAYALSGDHKKAIDAGCDDYISKPIQLKILLRKIDRLIERD